MYKKYLNKNIKYTFNGNSIEDGFDCMSLVHNVAKDYGYNIPNVNHVNSNIKNYNDLIKAEQQNTKWIEVEKQKNCLVLFRENGIVSHVGWMIDKYRFIHIRIVENTPKVDDINNPMWANRIEGFYRYED